MCQTKAEGGRRCARGQRLRDVSASDLAPRPAEGVPPVAWAGDDLTPLWEQYPSSSVCAGLGRLEGVSGREPAITERMRDVSGAAGGSLAGLEYRMKSPDSLVRKVHDRTTEAAAEDPGAGQSSAEEQAAGLKDVVRYTVTTADHDQLTETAVQTASGLQDRGCRIKEVKNFYRPGSTYKGVHFIVETPEGETTEVQVHSTRSLEIKEESHLHYEIARSADAEPAERMAATRRCQELADSLPDPPGIEGLEARISKVSEK